MKNRKITLVLIVVLSFAAVLIALPRIPVEVTTKYFTLDTYIGGYYFDFLSGRFVFDFTKVRKGLDIQGGVRVVLKADMSKIPETEKDSALKSAKEVIRRRVDLLGVAEPLIQTSKAGNDYRVIAELPGVTDVNEAIAQIGQTAQLTFKQIKKDEVYDPAKFQEYFLSPSFWEDTGVTGADLKGADVVFSGDNASLNSSPQIRIRFSTEGRNKFSEIAKNNINKPIAIYLDKSDTPLSMPVVNPDLADGLTSDPVITGTFSIQEANRLSISLRAGALPVPVEIIEQKTIGATLGEDSIKKSLIAGAIGVLIVFAFMVFSYGRLGVIANIALVIYTFITLAIFKIIPVTVTLPGLAGFILSIGMAVDANILTFERIKEELLWGRPFNLALRNGFERSWSSIKDSNVSSLLTSAILFHFGTGVVKGFALTLAVGIGVSLFTAIFVTRTLIDLLYRKA
ncbi:MAG: protein translocase subunit SecD [Patescibacteria group bacterium]